MGQINDLQPNGLQAGMENFEPNPPVGTNWSINDPFTSEIPREAGFVWLHNQSEYEDAFSYFEGLLIEKGRLGWSQALSKMRFLEIVAAYTSFA